MVEYIPLLNVFPAPDGTFSHINANHSIILQHASNMSAETVLVEAENVKDGAGYPLRWTSWSLSSDMEYVLFKTDHVKQWRHSSFGNYYIHRLADSTTFPISTPKYPPTITRVIWSPIGHGLAFVDENDLYVIEGSELQHAEPKIVRLTRDGSEVVFNGVPDWVYEEEVLETDSAMWWSPDGESLAFLRSDEAAVKDFKLQYYNPTNDAFESNQYPTELDMK
jgi:dipeptidyl aminopeptidase